MRRSIADTVLKGWPIVVDMAETMPGPPEVVWRLITDWEHQGDWMLEASDFVVLSEQREGVGVVAEATVKIGGISTRDEVRVTRWEPNEVLGIAHAGWVSGGGEIFMTPVGTATHVFWRETLYPPLGIVGALGLALFKPLMARIFVRDLRVLQGLVRAASA